MDRKIILKSNITDAVKHREANRQRADRAKTDEERSLYKKEFDEWSNKVQELREELKSL